MKTCNTRILLRIQNKSCCRMLINWMGIVFISKALSWMQTVCQQLNFNWFDTIWPTRVCDYLPCYSATNVNMLPVAIQHILIKQIRKDALYLDMTRDTCSNQCKEDGHTCIVLRTFLFDDGVCVLLKGPKRLEWLTFHVPTMLYRVFMLSITWSLVGLSRCRIARWHTQEIKWRAEHF